MDETCWKDANSLVEANEGSKNAQANPAVGTRTNKEGRATNQKATRTGKKHHSSNRAQGVREVANDKRSKCQEK